MVVLIKKSSLNGDGIAMMGIVTVVIALTGVGVMAVMMVIVNMVCKCKGC